MNNSAVVSKRPSFMIEDILRSTHDPQDETLTRECPSTLNAKENSSREAICAPEFEVPYKAKATRVYPSTQQKSILSDAFSVQPNPSKDQMTQLADYIGFKFEKVRRWFENRRKTEKRRHVKKLRELDNLASSLSSPRQPVSQDHPLRSSYYGNQASPRQPVSQDHPLRSSYYGNQACSPVSVPYPSATTYRNYGLVQRSYIRPMPLYRRTVQTSRVETESKQMEPAYKLTPALQHMPLTQMNALPSSSLRPLYNCKIPVVYRFQV